MGTVLAVVGVVLVLFVAAVLVTRDDPFLADAPQDAPDLALPEGPLQADDLAALRFSMAPRGYRMSEVDQVLDRLVAELADRDARLAQSEGRAPGGAGSTGSPGPLGTTAAPDPTAGPDPTAAQDATAAAIPGAPPSGLAPATSSGAPAWSALGPGSRTPGPGTTLGQ